MAAVAYTWDYASTRSDLRVLYEKSKDSMWNARTDLPWLRHRDLRRAPAALKPPTASCATWPRMTH